jgi:hypothetical protein
VYENQLWLLKARFGISFTAHEVRCLTEMAEEKAQIEGFEGSLFADTRAGVWGGQMLPDSLPLADNGFGDSLCVRFRPDGRVREVVFWGHEGSYWYPCAPTIEEALATTPEPEDVNLSVGTAFGVEEQRRLCRRALLRTCFGRSSAAELALPWPTMRRWMWDTASVPAEMRQRLAEKFHQPAEDLLRQNWLVAADAAESVLQTRCDLAWPYAVAGWAAERVGDIGKAVKTYAAGLVSLGSTADFTYTDGFESRSLGKFASWRLLELAPAGLSAWCRAYLDAVPEFKERDFWLHQGEAQERAGKPLKAYWCYYRAGWDSYVYPVTDVLERLHEAAVNASSRTLSELAKLHLDCDR